MRGRVGVVLSVALIGLLGPGCGSRETSRVEGKMDVNALGRVTELQLKEKLKDFAERYYVTLRGASYEISEQTKDPRIRKHAIYWKLITVPHVVRSIYQQKPVAALLDIWAFCVQFRLFFESPDSGHIFGEWTSITLKVARVNEEDIENRSEGGGFGLTLHGASRGASVERSTRLAGACTSRTTRGRRVYFTRPREPDLSRRGSARCPAASGGTRWRRMRALSLAREPLRRR